MRIGIPREIKDGERRVALTPDAIRGLIAAGHMVVVQSGAGTASGFGDADYAAGGAQLATAAEAYACDLVVKVKELQAAEWPLLQAGSMLMGFLHLGADAETCRHLLDRRITAIAYETVADANNELPILKPMSQMAGQLAIMVGQHLLLAPQGGRGLMMADARVVVFGAGSAGAAAANLAVALGADVTIASRYGPRLASLAHRLGSKARTLTIENADAGKLVAQADLVIGAAHTPGRATPVLLSAAQVRSMGAGSVLIEIGIDAGGIAQTSRPTTHAAPTFVAEGVAHYCVPNMPAAIPRSASLAISAAVLPFVQSIATTGLTAALRADVGLAGGLQMHGGSMTHAEIAARHGLPCRDLDALLHAC
ncbi:MAG: alanine dehydrogenase [Betaproteobacteria bacterium]|nr:alanine dehydrogenase [Betaproteobacteria bacterium]